MINDPTFKDGQEKIDFMDPNLLNLPSLVSTTQPKCFNETAKDQLHIVAVDCGIKNNQVGTTLGRILFLAPFGWFGWVGWNGLSYSKLPLVAIA